MKQKLYPQFQDIFNFLVKTSYWQEPSFLKCLLMFCYLQYSALYFGEPYEIGHKLWFVKRLNFTISPKISRNFSTSNNDSVAWMCSCAPLLFAVKCVNVYTSTSPPSHCVSAHRKGWTWIFLRFAAPSSLYFSVTRVDAKPIDHSCKEESRACCFGLNCVSGNVLLEEYRYYHINILYNCATTYIPLLP